MKYCTLGDLINNEDVINSNIMKLIILILKEFNIYHLFKKRVFHLAAMSKEYSVGELCYYNMIYTVLLYNNRENLTEEERRNCDNADIFLNSILKYFNIGEYEYFDDVATTDYSADILVNHHFDFYIDIFKGKL